MSKHLGRFTAIKKLPKLFGKLRKRSSKRISLKDVKKRVDASLKFLSKVDSYSTKDAFDALFDLDAVTYDLAGVSLEDDFDFANIIPPHVRTVAEYLEQKQFAVLFVKIASSTRQVLESSSANTWSMKVMSLILHLGRNFTYQSSCLCQQFGQSGGVECVLQIVSTVETLESKSDDMELPKEVAIVGLSVLQNCIRLCAKNRGVFRRANAVEILRHMRKGGMSSCEILLVLILAYIVNEEESESLAKSEDCVRILTLSLTEAVRSEAHYASVEGPASTNYFSAEELLDGLNHLAINDSNKAEIAKHGGVKTIIRMLGSDFSEEEHVIATQALWNLSFLDSIRRADEVQSSLPALHSLTSSDNQPIREASSYAIWEIQDNQRTVDPTHFNEPPPTYEESVEARVQNIREEQSGKAPADKERMEARAEKDREKGKTASVRQRDSSGHVMISYQWDSQDRVLAIRDHLLQAGYDVWVDVDRMGGDIVDAMADAVEKSSVVLVCMTERYKDSPNCRSEAKYASKKKKPIIPLLLEDGYDPDGWLGFLLGTKLYYEFYSDDEMTASMQGLLKAIGPRGQATAVEKQIPDDVDGSETPLAGPISMTSPAAGNQPESSTAAASTWSAEKVQSWLQEIGLSGLSSSLGFSCDGKHLKEMYEQYQRSPDVFQNEMKTELQLSYGDRLKLTTGLRKLFDTE